MADLQPITTALPAMMPTGSTSLSTKPQPHKPQERVRCRACDQDRHPAEMMRPGPDGTAECFTCSQQRMEAEQIAREAQGILDHMDAWVVEQLTAAGVSPRELKADRDKVPEPLKRAMPRDVLDALLAGQVPPRGFGLGGITDGGKTMAVVAVLKLAAAAYARRVAPEKGAATAFHRRVAFVDWPDEVNWIRAHGTEQARVAARVEHLSTVPLLVLDDLGRERIRGSYVEDWAASQLDGIVNARYRNERPTIWTTNVLEAGKDGQDLVSIYGSALVRRLRADNPLVWVKDLRPMSLGR